MKLKQFLSIPLLFLPFSTSIYASDRALDEATYTLVDGVGSTRTTNIFSGTDASQGILIDGINVKVSVSAWSDTGSHVTWKSNNGWQEGDEDETIKQATMGDYTNCYLSHGSCVSGTEAYGYGITNRDSSWRKNYYGDWYGTSEAHSVDNYNEKGLRDFDMFLLSFDQEVVLKGGTFSANYNDGGETNDVTVAGLDYDSANALFTGTSDFTWSDVSDTVIAGALGHFDISETKNSNNYYESSFSKNLTAAKYWLVGAYNTVFDQSASGSTNNVGFKLSSLTVGLEEKTTQPPTQVSEPGALALMSLGLGLVLYRRKRRV
tara:strand:- start:9 stop:965 length:957 start_codon:yes stop_codon:yes gene_type:complete